MIGLSISFCIGDILRGAVQESDCHAIVAGTNCHSIDQWNDLIEHYRTCYWSVDPDRGERILWRLINAGRIIQPRQVKPNLHPDELNIARGHWVTTKKPSRFIKAIWVDPPWAELLAEDGKRWMSTEEQYQRYPYANRFDGTNFWATERPVWLFLSLIMPDMGYSFANGMTVEDHMNNIRLAYGRHHQEVAI